MTRSTWRVTVPASAGEFGEDDVVEQTVGADRRNVFVGRLTEAVGQASTGGLDDRLDGGDVVGRHADRVDGDIHRPFGHQHVLPEVADAARASGLLLEPYQRIGEAQRVPAVVVGDAHLRFADVV